MGGHPEFNPRARRTGRAADSNFPLLWMAPQPAVPLNTLDDSLVVLGACIGRCSCLAQDRREITFGAQLAIPRVNAQSLAAAVK